MLKKVLESCHIWAKKCAYIYRGENYVRSEKGNFFQEQKTEDGRVSQQTN